MYLLGCWWPQAAAGTYDARIVYKHPGIANVGASVPKRERGLLTVATVPP